MMLEEIGKALLIVVVEEVGRAIIDTINED